jgi:hypothetical protein
MQPCTRAHGYAEICDQPSPARIAYRATAKDGAQLDDALHDTVEDAAALVVGAAHSQDPLPEHVVPRSVGGRPVVGKPIHVRLGDDLLAKVDALAAARGVSRADVVRDLVAAGIDAQQRAGL